MDPTKPIGVPYLKPPAQCSLEPVLADFLLNQMGKDD